MLAVSPELLFISSYSMSTQVEVVEETEAKASRRSTRASNAESKYFSQSNVEEVTIKRTRKSKQ
jgi:hypothetical protein